MEVRFVVNDEVVDLVLSPGGDESLLSYLRRTGKTDTKQMCEEGGCGACSVIEIVDGAAGSISRRALSACLITLPKAHDRRFVTSNQLSKSATGVALQKTFVDHFASQCGYCTPGFVVGVAASTTKEQREVELNGHICRCTGYFPIKNATDDAPFMDIEDLAGLCVTCPSRKGKSIQADYITPTSLSELLAAISAVESYQLIAGDTAKHVTKCYRSSGIKPPVTIDITKVAEMMTSTTIGSQLALGAVVSLEDIRNLFDASPVKVLNQAGEFLRRVGSISLRNQATWAGSICLQKEIPEFASDITVMLASLGMKLEVIDENNRNMTITVTEFQTSSAELLVVKGIIDTTGFEAVGDYVTFGKVMDRPTMAAGQLTFGFFSSARLFVSSTNGFKQIPSPPTTSVEELNKSLASQEDPLVRAELLRHYSKLRDETISPVSHHQESYAIDDSQQPASAKNVPQKHATYLCDGTADFSSDFTPAVDQVFLKFISAGQIGNLGQVDFTKCHEVKGFLRGITAEDIEEAGYQNTFIPSEYGTEFDEIIREELLVSQNILYHRQPVALVVANSQYAANKAAQLVQVFVDAWVHPEGLPEPVGMTEAIQKGDFFPAGVMAKRDRGDVDGALADNVNHRINGTFRLPGQYHMFMETHFARAEMKDEQIEVNLGTQALDKVQRSVAFCLGINHSAVVVKCRRMGGGFGGKATRTMWTACAAAVATKLTKRPAALHLSLEDCITIMGGRSIYHVEYQAAFEKKTGSCQAVDLKIYCEAGCSYNDSGANGLMTAMHMESNLGIPNIRFECITVRTASPAVTWLRAPGMLQAACVMAIIIDEGNAGGSNDYLEAYKASLMPRGFINLMGGVESSERNKEIIDDIIAASKVDDLQREIDTFNSANKWKKKALSVTGMKYPMDPAFHNNSCMINICRQDGTVQVHVGATDMGQATFTRAAQVAAAAFGIPLTMVNVMPTSSDVTCNAAPTGGTVSSQTACYLVDQACMILNQRLIDVTSVNSKDLNSVSPDNDPVDLTTLVNQKLNDVTTVNSKDLNLFSPHRDPVDIWKDSVTAAAARGVDLQARFKGAIPDGSYACYGSAVAVVEVDCLNGEHTIERMDCIYDAGAMINVGTELGQIEGGLVMGLGWLKIEDLTWDGKGPQQHGTWEYKVPQHLDIPKNFSVNLTNKFVEEEDGPRPFAIGSKQAGESSMLFSFAYRNALQRAVRTFNPLAKLIELPAKTDHIREALAVNTDELVLS